MKYNHMMCQTGSIRNVLLLFFTINDMVIHSFLPENTLNYIFSSTFIYLFIFLHQNDR